MTSYSKYVSEIIQFADETLNDLSENKNPKNLYSPINYIFSKKGKQIRPVLTLLSNFMFGGNMNDLKEVIKSIEELHNFTLIHDDVMDNAQLRRGIPTINTKWSKNQAILSGDVLLIRSYKQLLKSNVINKHIINQFTDTAIQICEGQQLDLDFQFKLTIKMDDYLNMIELKTGALIKFCLLVPCTILNISNKDVKIMEQVGSSLGQLFQIQDDYLDLYGKELAVGKKIGGDILEKKKTFLYVSALNKANVVIKNKLKAVYNSDNSMKLDEVISLYDDLNIKKHVESTINNLHQNILNLLSTIKFQEKKEKYFIEFLNSILKRKH
jgi:geranylgeranyl diphosphate synthase type II